MIAAAFSQVEARDSQHHGTWVVLAGDAEHQLDLTAPNPLVAIGVTRTMFMAVRCQGLFLPAFGIGGAAE